jgi:hypothetical protein
MEEFLPKEKWGDGPWTLEPDRLEFEAHGFPCLLNRAPVTGAWCGYVAVPPGHPLHGVWYGGCFKGCRKERKSYVSKKSIEAARRKGETAKLNMLVAMRNLQKSKMFKRQRKEHPRHVCGWRANHSPESILSVHGGITFSGECHGPICHKPKPGEPDNVWWYGFDCAHSGDLSPAMEARLAQLRTVIPGFPDRSEILAGFRDVYRTMEYAKEETERLARQLASVRCNGKTLALGYTPE